MADLDTVGVLAEDLALAFVPLSNAFASAAAFRDFLEGFGWDFTTPPPALDSIKAPTLAVTVHVVGREVEQAEVPQLLIDLDGAIEAILDLENASGLSDEFKSTFPRELIDALIVSHLLDFRPRLGCLLQTFGLIRLENVDATSERPAYIRRVLAFEDVDDFLSNPLDYVKERYRWGQSDFDGEALFDALSGLLLAWDLDVREEQVDAQTLAHLQASALSPDDAFDSMLRLVFIEHSLDQSLLSAGVGLYFLPETSSAKPGLAFLTSTSADFEAEVDVADNLTLAFESHADLAGGVGALVRPNQDVQVLSGLEGGSPAALGTELRAALRLGQPEAPVVLLGTPAASRFEFGGISTILGTRAHSSGGFEVFTELTLEDGRIVVKPSPGEHDSFLASLLPANGLQVDFELGVGFSSKRGLYFSGSGGFEVPLPVHLQVGPVEITGGLLAVRFGAGGVPVDLSATIRANLSVLSVTVQNVGLTANFTFADDRSGNLGPLSVSLDFKPPNGAGIVIDAGPVAGGGFVYFDPVTRRYAGAFELSVFSVSVKAFGLIDTVLPDGSDGFSFVIIIVAEFTPIQLGFGFTLVGVGGLIGIHRTVDDQALGEAVRTGSLAHLLFPVNVVANAPAIINDLAAVFPATRDHYVFGPMAKFGWGTPTLITADLGIIIEFPGPRLALLGVVRVLLPSADFAILRLNAAIAGILDFPAGRFEINASLFDSSVAGYVVSGDMAFRMQLGDRPSFLLSIGGFNSAFQAPPGFPALRRASADLGVNGNPSLTATGYFAITSNSAQFGASIQLRASGYGIRLTGGYGFDVLFVFSPFSFTASVHAGVRVSFHGFGLGVTLHGSMSGPTPWHFKGRVCVEVAFWDACLPIDVTFGREEPAALPEMDPWLGNEDPNLDPRVQVIGLGTAVSDPRNWEGEQPADGYSVVSLAAAATLDRTPIDPVGPATLRQKVCPLNQELEKFGEYVPIVNTHFDVSAVKLAGTEVPYDLVEDEFARGQFENLSTAEKLSASSYDQMVAGVRIAPNSVTAGAAGTHTLEYETVFVNPAGERVAEETSDPRFVPTRNQLLGMLKRSAAGRAGVRRSGVQKYMLTGKPKLLTLDAPTFIVVDACTHVWNTTITPVDVSQTLARTKLKAYEKANPSERGRFAVVPFYARAA